MAQQRTQLIGGVRQVRNKRIEASRRVDAGRGQRCHVRQSPLGWLMRKDYHTVPTLLARNKELAEYFRKMWARYVGPTQLVYTRTPEGRSFLLKARARSMARSFQRRAERLRSWQ